MTDRAQRAAKVLQECGWDISDYTSHACASCATTLDGSMRFCWNCGARAPLVGSGLEQLEAAIAAANQEPGA